MPTGVQTGGIYGAPTTYSQQYQANLDANSNAAAQRKASALGVLGPAVQGLFNSAATSFGLGGGAGNGGATGTSPASSFGSSSNNVMPNIYGGGANPSTPSGGAASFAAPSQAAPVTLAPPDMTASNAAAFANAKDQVGLESRGALTALKGAMAGRGISGSGVEGRATANVINQGQQQLGDVSRQQAITNATLAQQNAETAYQGGITQRGQDINQSVAGLNAGVTERGQDIGAATTQRGQDVGLTEAQMGNQTQLQVENDRLAAQRQQALLGLLGTQLSSLGSLSY